MNTDTGELILTLGDDRADPSESVYIITVGAETAKPGSVETLLYWVDVRDQCRDAVLQQPSLFSPATHKTKVFKPEVTLKWELETLIET